MAPPLAEFLEALKREYGGVPRPAEAMERAPSPAPSPVATEAAPSPVATATLSVTLTPEQKEKIKEVLEKIMEIEVKGIKKAGELIQKLFEKYKKQKELAKATGEEVDMEKVFREAGIEVKGEIGVYKI